jgi:hypothetical protein
MTSTLPRRTAAVAALTVAAFSGVAVAGAAAPSFASTYKVHTSLSIRAAHSSINPGGGDVISGQLRAPRGGVADRWIELDAKPAGATAWTKNKAHFTGARGVIAFQVTPTVDTRYRLVFNGNKNEQASISGVVNVNVRSKATSLTISATSTSIAPGTADTINGVLSVGGVPLAGGLVKLLSATGNNLAKTGSAVSAADGTVSFSVAPKSTTHYALVFNKTATAGYARSAVLTVHVLQNSSLSIRAVIGKKGKEIISGTLRGGGHVIQHDKVTLQSRVSGTSTWAPVASQGTGRTGFVSFAVPAPSVSEDYQLVFSGGPRFNGCQSGVVTVTVA